MVAFNGDESRVLASLARNVYAGKAAHDGSGDDEALVRMPSLKVFQQRALVCVDPLDRLEFRSRPGTETRFTSRAPCQVKAPFNPRSPAFTFQRAGQCVIRLGIERQRRCRKPEVIEGKAKVVVILERAV